MIDQYAIKYLDDLAEKNHNFDMSWDMREAVRIGRDAIKERIERSNGCCFCLDASIDPELEGYDLSYHCVGYADKNYRFLIKSGGGKPMEILFERWQNDQWNTIGFYEPQCCPMCGRKLPEPPKEVTT